MINEQYALDDLIELRCGEQATIIQERTDDGFYLFLIHGPDEIHRLSEWNIFKIVHRKWWHV